MWWGGSSVPARFLVAGSRCWRCRWPGSSAAADWPDRRAAYRLLLLIGLGAAIATVRAQRATVALGRNGISRLLQWLSPDWHLWAFAPDFIVQHRARDSRRRIWLLPSRSPRGRGAARGPRTPRAAVREPGEASRS